MRSSVSKRRDSFIIRTQLFPPGGPNYRFAPRYWLVGPRGPRADHLRNEGGLLDQAIDSLSLILNTSTAEIRGQIEASHIHDWHDDRFSRGAYSYVPVDGLEAQEALSQPLDNKLFFAGEATCTGHVGTVHGAIQSGRRAAREILRHLTGTHASGVQSPPVPGYCITFRQTIEYRQRRCCRTCAPGKISAQRARTSGMVGYEPVLPCSAQAARTSLGGFSRPL